MPQYQGIRLSAIELETVRDNIAAYVEECADAEENDINYTTKLSMPGEGRFLEVDLIVTVIDDFIGWNVINVALISQDEFLDIMNNTKNQ